MNPHPDLPDLVSRSVVALPPVARDAGGSLSVAQNRRLVEFVEAGGIRILLYGSNALVHQIRPGEYAALVAMLQDIAGPDTVVIPAIGPAHGVMMDQAAVLRGTAFPSVQILPSAEDFTTPGFERAVGEVAALLERPVVVTITEPGPVTPPVARRLIERGEVSLVLYEVRRANPTEDPLLRELVGTVDPRRVVSALGEPVSIVHLRDFGVGGFASGCACVASRLSQSLLRLSREEQWGEAEEIRGLFRKLEDLRTKQHPVAVLHEAVTFAGVAEMGPVPPMLGPVNERYLSRLREAAQTLHAEEIND